RAGSGDRAYRTRPSKIDDPRARNVLGILDLKRLDGVILVRVDEEQVDQVSDLEDVAHGGTQPAQAEPAFGDLHLAVEHDKLAQRQAGEVLDRVEVEQQRRPPQVLHQAVELVASLART